MQPAAAAVAIAIAAPGLLGCTHTPRIALPQGEAYEEVAFLRGVSAKAKLDGYLVPSLRIRPGEGGQRAAIFTIERGGQPVTKVRCLGRAVGRTTLSELVCTGDGFDLSLAESSKAGLRGTFERGPIALRLEPARSSPSDANEPLVGFHVYRDRRWLGAFERFWGGLAYFSQALTTAEREAMSLVAVAIVGAERWLEGGGEVLSSGER